MTVGGRIGRLCRLGGCIRRPYSTAIPPRNLKKTNTPINVPDNNPPKRPLPSMFQNDASINGPSSTLVSVFENAEVHVLGRRGAFRPATKINEMPLPNPQAASSMSLPEHQLLSAKEEDEGYIYIHCVTVSKNTHVTVTNYKRNP